MTHLRPTNAKLHDRALRILMEIHGIPIEIAKGYLDQYEKVHIASEALTRDGYSPKVQ
jgi:N-acetylmuramic acid 6-phosphate (MurNAc-6-P) etherase